MKTKAIRAAAQIYLNNRNKQSEIPWNKDEDQSRLFAAMKEAGLSGVNATGGTHFGTLASAKSKKLVVVNIGDEVTIARYKDFSDYLNSITVIN